MATPSGITTSSGTLRIVKIAVAFIARMKSGPTTDSESKRSL